MLLSISTISSNLLRKRNIFLTFKTAICYRFSYCRPILVVSILFNSITYYSLVIIIFFIIRCKSKINFKSDLLYAWKFSSMCIFHNHYIPNFVKGFHYQNPPLCLHRWSLNLQFSLKVEQFLHLEKCNLKLIFFYPTAKSASLIA